MMNDYVADYEFYELRDTVTQLETRIEDLEAKLANRKCISREELLGAIARGWCSQKNSHKIMDADLADAIFVEVEKLLKNISQSNEEKNDD